MLCLCILNIWHTLLKENKCRFKLQGTWTSYLALLFHCCGKCHNLKIYQLYKHSSLLVIWIWHTEQTELDWPTKEVILILYNWNTLHFHQYIHTYRKNMYMTYILMETVIVTFTQRKKKTFFILVYIIQVLYLVVMHRQHNCKYEMIIHYFSKFLLGEAGTWRNNEYMVIYIH